MDYESKLSLRRLRSSPQIRELTKSVRVSHQQFIQPLFLVEGLKERTPVTALTGVFRETSESILVQVERDLEAGVSKFLLFGVPEHKSARHFDYEGLALGVAAIKQKFGQDIWLSVDVCLCSHTSHGQCGILNPEENHVENHATVAQLAAQATAFAQAGADCVAPSDMMDGRVGAIRAALDKLGLQDKLIMSYAAKFHSKLYGPFREAADSSPKQSQIKDRATYQIDPANPRDAYQSALRDAAEGADILMVKPGLPYLDILSNLSQKIAKPWAVYQVSGEYAAVELLADKNLINREAAHVENWTSMVRAGADAVISYGARHAREWLRELQ
jgi:porphobilinogen synthase